MKVQSFFEEDRPEADQRAVQECTDDRADADTAQGRKAKKEERKQNGNEAACAVIAGFEFVNAYFPSGRHLFDEKIVCFG